MTTFRLLLAGVALAILPGLAHARPQAHAPSTEPAMSPSTTATTAPALAPDHLRGFDVVELRRYTVSPGQRARAERIVAAPTPRSRLRWLDSTAAAAAAP